MELQHAALLPILALERRSQSLIDYHLWLVLFFGLLRSYLAQNGLRLLCDVVQYVLEAFRQQLLTAVFEHEEAHLQYRLPASDEEVVPELQDVLTHFSFLVGLIRFGWILDAVGEDGDEPCGCEVARIDHLVLEVRVQVWLKD